VKSIKGTDLFLDSDGDLDISGGDLSLAEGIEAIGQHVNQRLRLFLGEWFLDINAGVPFFQNIFVKRPNFAVVEGIFRDQILSTAGILELNSFNFDYNNTTRSLSISFTARTINGV